MALNGSTHKRARVPRKAALKVTLNKAGSGSPKRALLASLAKNPAAAKAAPVDPLKEAVDAGVQLRYGQAESVLRQQQKDIPGYFKAYQEQLARASEANRQAAAAAQAGFQQTIAGTSAADAARAGQAGEAMQADAARRGAVVDPRLAQESADAASVRRQMLAALAGESAVAGQSQAGLDAQAVRSGAAQLVGAQQASARKLADLTAEKAAYGADLKAKLEAAAAEQAQKEQEAAFDQQLAAAAFGLDVKKAQTAERNAAQDRSIKRAAARQSAADKAGKVNSYGYTAAEWKSMSTAERQAAIKAYKQNTALPKDPKKPKSPWLPQASQNSAKDAIDGAVSTINKLKAEGLSQAEVRKVLLNGRPSQTIKNGDKSLTIPGVSKVAKAWVNVAMDVVFNGYISQANVKALQKRRIKVNPLGYPTKKPAGSTTAFAGVGTGATGTVGTT